MKDNKPVKLNPKAEIVKPVKVKSETVKPKPPPPVEKPLEEMIAKRRNTVLQLQHEIAELEVKRQEAWDEFTRTAIGGRKTHIKNWMASIEGLEKRLRIRDGK